MNQPTTQELREEIKQLEAIIERDAPNVELQKKIEVADKRRAELNAELKVLERKLAEENSPRPIVEPKKFTSAEPIEAVEKRPGKLESMAEKKPTYRYYFDKLTEREKRQVSKRFCAYL